jgi:hypothetical protein
MIEYEWVVQIQGKEMVCLMLYHKLTNTNNFESWQEAD